MRLRTESRFSKVVDSLAENVAKNVANVANVASRTRADDVTATKNTNAPLPSRTQGDAVPVGERGAASGATRVADLKLGAKPLPRTFEGWFELGRGTPAALAHDVERSPAL